MSVPVSHQQSPEYISGNGQEDIHGKDESSFQVQSIKTPVLEEKDEGQKKVSDASDPNTAGHQHDHTAAVQVVTREKRKRSAEDTSSMLISTYALFTAGHVSSPNFVTGSNNKHQRKMSSVNSSLESGEHSQQNMNDENIVNKKSSCDPFQLMDQSTQMWLLMLDELTFANKTWKINANNTKHLDMNIADSIQQEFYNRLYYQHSKIIKQHTKLSAVDRLWRQDRISLIKNQVPYCMLVQASTKYNPNSKQIQMDSTGLSSAIIHFPNGIIDNNWKERQTLFESYPNEFRQNKTVTMITCAIAMLDPDCPNVVHKEAVEDERQGYLELLKYYLENTYNSATARQGYKKLVKWLNKMKFYKINSDKGFFELAVHPYTFEILQFDIPGVGIRRGADSASSLPNSQ